MQHNPYQAPIVAGPPRAGAPAPAGGPYEFDEIENRTIAKMGRRARLWGIFCLVTGIVGLLCLGAVMAVSAKIAAETEIEMSWILLGVGALAPVVLTHLIIAFNYMGSGKALLAVVNTQGEDVSLLMRALHKLGTAFMVEVIVGALAMLIGLVAGGALLVFETDEFDNSSSFDFDD